MPRHAIVLIAAIALACATASSAAGASPAALRTRLTTALAGPGVSLGTTGAIAVELATGTLVYAHNADAPFAPASNEKLPVAWAALVRLGPDYRFHTELYGVGMRDGATWRGDLVLKGFGDPTLTSGDLARLARVIRARGIRRVTGRILGDETFYDAQRAVAGWKPSFVGVETPPLSALVVDRARGWPALSPPLLAARMLRDALAGRGVSVGGRPGLGSAPATASSLASDVSDPLARVVRQMNQESDNFYAEMLLKQLGAATGVRGSSAAGARVVLDTMREAGIPVAGVRLVDGSGLSRLDRLTPAALVGILRAGLTDPDLRRPFLDSFAVAGVSGTLRQRLPALTGRMKGKTGTTDLACTLSGVLRGAVAFAVLENGTPVSSWAARAAQDRFVTVLAAAAA